jgi:hypothetical protein
LLRTIGAPRYGFLTKALEHDQQGIRSALHMDGHGRLAGRYLLSRSRAPIGPLRFVGSRADPVREVYLANTVQSACQFGRLFRGDTLKRITKAADADMP